MTNSKRKRKTKRKQVVVTVKKRIDSEVRDLMTVMTIAVLTIVEIVADEMTLSAKRMIIPPIALEVIATEIVTDAGIAMIETLVDISVTTVILVDAEAVVVTSTDAGMITERIPDATGMMTMIMTGIMFGVEMTMTETLSVVAEVTVEITVITDAGIMIVVMQTAVVGAAVAMLVDAETTIGTGTDVGGMIIGTMTVIVPEAIVVMKVDVETMVSVGKDVKMSFEDCYQPSLKNANLQNKQRP